MRADWWTNNTPYMYNALCKDTDVFFIVVILTSFENPC